MSTSSAASTESRDGPPAAPGIAIRALVVVCGLVVGVVIGVVTFWVLPLTLVAAVGLAVVAGTVERPRWLPSLLWAGSLGATLPFLLAMLGPLLQAD